MSKKQSNSEPPDIKFRPTPSPGPPLPRSSKVEVKVELNPLKYEDSIIARLLDLDKEDTSTINTTYAGDIPKEITLEKILGAIEYFKGHIPDKAISRIEISLKTAWILKRELLFTVWKSSLIYGVPCYIIEDLKEPYRIIYEEEE